MWPDSSWGEYSRNPSSRQMRRLVVCRMEWPGWPGCSQEDTLDLAADMAASETGQAPMEFWSSLESTKGWDGGLVWGSVGCMYV